MTDTRPACDTNVSVWFGRKTVVGVVEAHVGGTESFIIVRFPNRNGKVIGRTLPWKTAFDKESGLAFAYPIAE